MLLFVIRKMLNNRLMVSCLLIGFILAVAMVTSIPMYTDGILQRMLTRDLENYQINSGNFPGRYHIKVPYSTQKWKKIYDIYDKKITNEMVKDIGLPYLSNSKQLTINYLAAIPAVQREEKPKKRFFKLEALSGIDDYVDILQGKAPSDKVENNAYEVMVTEEAIQKLDLLLDEEYSIFSVTGKKKYPFKIKVVGVYSIKDKGDGYWFQGMGAYRESFIMNYSLFCNEFVEKSSIPLTSSQWYYAFDYHNVKVANLKSILSSHDSQKKWLSSNVSVNYNFPMIPIIKQYYDREKQLKITLWVLQVPILLMLAFYLFMMSRLTIQREQNEISIMQSRGAGPGQIFWGYLLEGIVLSVVGVVIGPILGLLLCKVLGASNGFLEFVGRVSLPISLKWDYYLYSVWALVFAVICLLIPVLSASKHSIVSHKQTKSGRSSSSIWKKYYFDIVLLAIAGYGIYTFRARQSILTVTGVEATEISMDPLLFLVSVFFILGIGLLFLRIYPYIVRFIFWLGKKIWSPTLYASFIQVGRASGQDQFLMIFLILALSIGLFGANSARTVNKNIEEKIRYSVGGDLAIKGTWETTEVKTSGGGMGGMQPPAPSSGSNHGEAVKYIEPLFEPYTKLSGVDIATKVFIQPKGIVEIPSEGSSGAYIMGVIPNEFGKVSCLRPDLTKPYHWYQYLNLLSKAPKAFLISSSLKKEYGLKVGDSITIRWQDQALLDGIVYGVVDYWPTYNPNEKENSKDKLHLVVANLSYIQAKTAIEPYEIWLKKKDGATSEQIYKSIEENKISISKINDASQEIIKKKNDPMLQGMNGALTLGFIVAMFISTIGFLIYWILSIRSRVLQFGIFRAMGMPRKKLIGMLIWEQILTSGVAVLAGIIIGGVASDLFVPFLQIAYSAADQVPPFKVVAYAGDYIKVYIVVAVMLIASLGVLGYFVSHLKIHQALKLGED